MALHTSRDGKQQLLHLASQHHCVLQGATALPLSPAATLHAVGKAPSRSGLWPRRRFSDLPIATGDAWSRQLTLHPVTRLVGTPRVALVPALASDMFFCSQRVPLAFLQLWSGSKSFGGTQRSPPPR